jgi:glycosyltransferase involved in cell wall biosynthesis
MKIVMLSKALVVGAYQKKLEELARLPGVTLVALVPAAWREPRVGITRLERRFTEGYRLEVVPMLANGRHHLHCYPGLARLLARERPDVFHIDEESFNLATFLAMRAGVAVGSRCCFYNWANMERFYPPPFCFFERYAFRHARYAIAGNAEAVTIMRRHGYSGPVAVLPQFGVDPHLFAPAPQSPAVQPEHGEPRPFRVGYVGRLIEAKGVLDLVEAVAGLPPSVHLRLVGEGVLRPRIEQYARELGLHERIKLTGAVASTEIPAMLQHMDVVVLPSRTTPTWKEQFGRVLVEAMSCGVAVIGSSSGEIPHVIGDAGLIVPEGESEALRAALLRLVHAPALCRQLGQRGRARVLEHYTQAALARSYYAVYRAMLQPPA